jgi:hypothetical protein
MSEQETKALKCVVFAQSFVEALDDFGGSSAFKHQLKNKGNAFVKEVDKFLDDAYSNGGTETPLINLIEDCHWAIDELIDKSVIVKSKNTEDE